MKLTSIHRRDGRIAIEYRLRDEDEVFEHGDLEDVPSRSLWRVKQGLRGTYAETSYVGPNDPVMGRPNGKLLRTWLGSPDGIPGNSDWRVKRTEGWRGTTNDVSITAYGVRLIEESRPVKRGRGWRVVLSRKEA